MAATPSEPQQASQEPLKYQKWVLKVSIHCEGCKRKVKKVLHSIEGVYTTTIDAQHHKVTVTGDVHADTLIKKLVRTGKHAELWPEEKNENKQGNDGKKKKKKKKKKKQGNDGKLDPESSEEDSCNSTEKDEEVEQICTTVNANGEITVTSTNGNQVDIKHSACDGPGSGKGGKKKKKRGHNGGNNSSNVETNVVAPGCIGSPTPLVPVHFYPRAVGFDLPSYGPPLHAASYNTSYPSSTTTGNNAGYSYAAYAYKHSDFYIPSQPLDSVDDECDDEDEATVCSIM